MEHSRKAIYNSQLSNLYKIFGELGAHLLTQTETLSRLGYTPYTGSLDVLKDLGIKQVLGASEGMSRLYTMTYNSDTGTGAISFKGKGVNSLNGLVNMLEAKNSCSTYLYCDTSITGNCLFFAFYKRPSSR